MNVTGINLKADLLRIVTLSGSKGEHIRLEEKFNKVQIPRDNGADELKEVRELLMSYFKNNNIEKVAVNGRVMKGQMAGSPLSFKSEGFLMGILDLEIKNIFSATLRATDRKRSDEKSCRPSTKDLGVAYDIAFELLPD